MRLLTRLTIALLVFFMCIWFLPMMIFLTATSGVFFKQFGKEPINFDELTLADVKPDIAVQGECYFVYDLVGIDYTEGETSYTGRTITKDNYYYWVVDCGDNALMLVKTDASGVLSAYMDDIVDAYWNSDTFEDFKENYPGTAYLDGVFIGNSPEIVGFYNDWIAELSEFDDSWKDLSLAPFTLDCSWTYAEHLRQFYTGVIMLVITIVGIIALSVFLVKRKKSSRTAVPVTAFGYGRYSDYRGYNDTNSVQNNASHLTFQTQTRSSGYSGYDTYRSQNNASHPTFQTQTGSSGYSGYDTNSVQNNASHLTFQTQTESLRYSGYDTNSVQNNPSHQTQTESLRYNGYDTNSVQNNPSRQTQTGSSGYSGYDTYRSQNNAPDCMFQAQGSTSKYHASGCDEYSSTYPSQHSS